MYIYTHIYRFLCSHTCIKIKNYIDKNIKFLSTQILSDTKKENVIDFYLIKNCKS